MLYASPRSVLCRLVVFWNAFTLIDTAAIERRETIPAPIVVPASQDWDGPDGPWSSFNIQIGTPSQNVKVLISTASTQTWAIDPEGCVPNFDPANCTTTRGRIYNNTLSSSWVPNLANLTTQIYDLVLESHLGYAGKGRYGFDKITLGLLGEGGPTLENQTVGSISTTEFWLGNFGLNPRASNFTDYNEPVPSFMTNLRSKGLIPSLSWSYTAGNRYQLNSVLGSLVLGGHDTSKYIPNNVTFPMAPANDRDLVVQLLSITSADTALLPTPIPIFLDSTVPFIYLPLAACLLFEQRFGLVWDEASSLYLLSAAQHAALVTENPSVKFVLGNMTDGVEAAIELPYGAFDLAVSYPYVDTYTRYFPLKRANDTAQYTLGRTFFQEAYLIADYDRYTFSVSQAKFDPSARQTIVPILPPSNATSSTSSSKSTFPLGAKIGIAVAAVLLLLLVVACVFFFRRRKAKNEAQKTADAVASEALNPGPDGTEKPELDGVGAEKTEQREEILEIDGVGREKGGVWRVGMEEEERAELGGVGRAVEMGSGEREVYEMDAGEVAVEMASPVSAQAVTGTGGASVLIPNALRPGNTTEGMASTPTTATGTTDVMVPEALRPGNRVEGMASTPAVTSTANSDGLIPEPLRPGRRRESGTGNVE